VLRSRGAWRWKSRRFAHVYGLFDFRRGALLHVHVATGECRAAIALRRGDRRGEDAGDGFEAIFVAYALVRKRDAGFPMFMSAFHTFDSTLFSCAHTVQLCRHQSIGLAPSSSACPASCCPCLSPYRAAAGSPCRDQLFNATRFCSGYGSDWRSRNGDAVVMRVSRSMLITKQRGDQNKRGDSRCRGPESRTSAWCVIGQRTFTCKCSI